MCLIILNSENNFVESMKSVKDFETTVTSLNLCNLLKYHPFKEKFPKIHIIYVNILLKKYILLNSYNLPIYSK